MDRKGIEVVKQSNNARVKMFGNTPVFGYGEMQLFAQD